MAYSYKEYTSRSSGQREFTFAFDAVAKDTTNIKVTVGGKHLYDGVSKYNTSTRALDDSGTQPEAEYTVSSGSITIKTTANSAAVTFTLGNVTVTNGVPTLSASVPLRIYRETNRDTAEVTFSSGSILADSDLNRANNQGRFLALEAVDRADESMAIDPDDSTQYDIQISGADKRIFGVADPDNTNDAANKAYVDGVAMGSGANIVTTNGSQTLTTKTLTSPVLNTGVSGTAVKDEDDMSSNSASHLATQQSIKAYVDAQIATEDTIAELNDTTITGTPADNEVLAYDSSSSKWINQTASEAGLAASSDVLSLIDEDNMATDSATRPPSQQSVKAYVNSEDALYGYQGEPHIISGVLYPGISDKQLDGTTALAASTTGPGGSTVASSKYGTVQSDGRMYYYTDIKGSKPIKDPRIGAHFGSQRHKFKSLQLLEQETATHGNNVYSVDGREWIRGVGDWQVANNTSGNLMQQVSHNNNATDRIEIVGYFSGANLIGFTGTSDKAEFSVNGGSASTSDFLNASVNTPLNGRYVDAGGVVHLTSSLTLGINTLTIIPDGTVGTYYYGIELIAQDTTSTANRSKIQIPSQDVVSYGKKFTVSGTPHYDPFSTKTDGSAWTSPTSGTNNTNSSASWPTNIDTATSLGLSKWVDGSNYYRPYNGGRVVHWVDSSGTIKTSVTVMPPNAKSIKSADENKKAKNAPNDTYLPTFEDETTDVNEDNLHEVAKTFYWREFGNGSANGGAVTSSTGGNYKDFSMLSGTTGADMGFVLDDGLTSLSAKNCEVNSNGLGNNLGIKTTDSAIYYTFIGTGITISDYNGSPRTFGQNLPYGTHLVKQHHDGSNVDWFLDGVQLLEGDSGDTAITSREITFYQPKKPPIPEDACVISDYCLMADFVPQTSAGDHFISKGVRRQNISRDCFCDETDGNAFTFNIKEGTAGGFRLYLDGTADSDTSMKVRIPSFGTNYVHRGYQSDTRSKLFIGDTDNDSNATKDNTAGYGSYAHLTSSLSLGIHQFGSNAASGQNGNVTAYDIATPIHTSHHYQTFETPFLHELVGGDRNMEQTNLVVSPNGRTWDELTRDTSYLGPSAQLEIQCDDDTGTSSGIIIFTVHRGGATTNHYNNKFNKDIAYGYDRAIILRDGVYRIGFKLFAYVADVDGCIKLNDSSAAFSNELLHIRADPANHTIWSETTRELKRGDFLCCYFNNTIQDNHMIFSISKID